MNLYDEHFFFGVLFVSKTVGAIKVPESIGRMVLQEHQDSQPYLKTTVYPSVSCERAYEGINTTFTDFNSLQIMREFG